MIQKSVFSIYWNKVASVVLTEFKYIPGSDKK